MRKLFIFLFLLIPAISLAMTNEDLRSELIESPTVLDTETEAALIKYQIENAAQILGGDGVLNFLGNLDPLTNKNMFGTKMAANNFFPVANSAITNTAPTFTLNLWKGMEHPDVKKLQQFLNSKGFIIAASGSGSVGQETTYYGEATAVAVTRFQEAYASTILKPNDLTRGNGQFLTSTRAQANALNGSTTKSTGVTKVPAVPVSSTKPINSQKVTNKYTLTVKINGSGTVTSKDGQTCSTETCVFVVDKNTKIDLKASPVTGNKLEKWSGACRGNKTSCSIKLTKNNSVTVNFGPKIRKGGSGGGGSSSGGSSSGGSTPVSTYVLTAAVSGSGTVSGSGINCPSDCTESFNDGSSVTLTAVPSSGNVFAGWTGVCSGTSSTCVVSMTAARTASASFESEPETDNSTVFNGWTNLHTLINSSPYASSRVVYVSSSLGNDSTGQVYTPSSEALGGQPLEPTGTIAPYQTLAAAWAQIRNGQADVMLLRRGDIWAESLYTNKLGASASARIIVAAYGPVTTARPQVGYLFPDHATAAGNQLLAHYVSAFPSNSEVATRGVNTRFEGVMFTSTPATVSPAFVLAVSEGVDVYRCGTSRVRLFTAQEIGRGNMTFWDNVLWHPVGYVGSGGFEHNNYFQFNTGDIDSRRNISANSPGVGWRQRGLGTVEANLTLGAKISNYDIGTSVYYGEGDPSDRGTFLNFRYNLGLHSPGAYAMYDIKNAVIEDNILLDGQYMLYFENEASEGNPLPLTNVTVQDNIVYNTNILPASGHSNSVTGPYLIRRNDFQRPDGGDLIRAMSDDFTYEANNRFYSNSATSTWFSGYTDDYNSYVPSRGSNTQVTYPNPNRDLVTYMQTLGVSPDDAEEAIDWFINGVPGQPTLQGSMNNRLGDWDQRFTSIAVINHVRAGFGLPAISD